MHRQLFDGEENRRKTLSNIVKMPSSKIRAEQNEKGLRNAPKRCKAITGLFKYIWDLLFTF